MESDDPTMQGAPIPVLSATGIAKAFGATRALRGAGIALGPGEVHALLGENGAGKSTLVKIMAGALAPDEGTLTFRGAEIRLGSVRDAVRLGIVPIYQHLSLMPHLSVLDNLFAFEWASGSMWRGRPEALSRRRAESMLARVGLTIDPDSVLGGLSLAERQLVEIARGVARDCAVLILDEPTASLNRAETERLFAAVRDLCADGKAILLISHNLGEVEEIADRISILRDGTSVAEGVPRGRLSRRDIVERMIGRGLDGPARHDLPEPGATVLRVEDLAVPGALEGASLELRRGEILGVVGLIGSGAIQLGQSVAGLVRPAGGRVLCDGRAVAPGNRAAALAAGIGLVPAERESEGVFPGRPVIENASVAGLGELTRGGWLNPAAERRRFAPWLGALRVVPDDMEAPIDSLSGGNQQKVLLVRGLARENLPVLVAIEPTRGVDVGARDTIHRALIEAARRGTGILVVSSEIDEVTVICHRVIVLRDGRTVAELPGDSDPSAILGRLTGVAA